MHVFSARNIAASLASLTAMGWTAWYYLDFFTFGLWPLLVLSVASVLTGLWWLSDYAKERAHHQEMEDFAARHGWSFMHGGGDWSRRLSRYPFGQGTHRRDTAILRGTFAGLACATFVHEFETRSDDRATAAQVFQITAVDLPFPLESLDVVPEDAAARVFKFLGGQDIQFESADFNAKWRVKARNAKFAHDVLHPRMLERLNQYDAQGLALRIEGDTLLCWQAGRQSVDTLAKRLSVLCGFAKLIPEHVYRQFAEVHEHTRLGRTDAEDSAPDWARTPGRLTDGQFNPELLDPKYEEKLPEIDSGAALSKRVDSYFPTGFFLGGGGFGGFDGGGE